MKEVSALIILGEQVPGELGAAQIYAVEVRQEQLIAKEILMEQIWVQPVEPIWDANVQASQKQPNIVDVGGIGNITQKNAN